jgi:hypothetical protein
MGDELLPVGMKRQGMAATAGEHAQLSQNQTQAQGLSHC